MRGAVRAAVSLTVLCLSVFAFAGPSADNLENPAWNAKKIPSAAEPPLKSSAAKEWADASAKKPSKSCDQAQVWRLLPTSKISAVVMKEIKVPVKGAFDRFNAFLFADKKSNQLQSGEGSIDLSSYDSGVEARDRRVQRYVFDAEKEGRAVAKVTVSFNKGLAIPTKGTTNGELDVDVEMNGGHFKSNLPVKLSRISEKGAHLVSDRDGSFTYVTDEVKPRVLQMMKECNHHFLSTFVNVGLDLSLENTCAR